MTRKILVCDDEPHILESVGYLVKKLGCECEMAANGQQALERARALMPDLLILDVRMPKMNGFEVCERLKADTLTRGIYIIMLTAFGQSHDAHSCYAAGADEYLAKPFSPRALKAKLSKLLGAMEEKQ